VRAIVFLLVSALLLLPQTACEGTRAGAVSAPQTVNVSMTDYSFKLTPATVLPGQVTFVVKNDSAMQMHQIVVVKTYLQADELPDAFPGRMVDEGSDVMAKVGALGDLAPGQTGRMTVELDPGHYVYLCDTPGHYMKGMYGDINVMP
jgi:uncharacterized cupredoxin-like copper-binding protein